MRGLIVALLLVLGARAHAQSDAAEPRVLLSVSAGAALAFSSLAFGSVVLATEDSNHGRKVGALTMVSGIALSPILSHAIAGEWARAALFGSVPVAAAIGAAIMIESAPTLLGNGALSQRRMLTLCYCVDLLSAAIGLFDSMNAGERARERALALRPWVDRRSLGIGVGGWL